jgi:hypothetical protein
MIDIKDLTEEEFSRLLKSSLLKPSNTEIVENSVSKGSV